MKRKVVRLALCCRSGSGIRTTMMSNLISELTGKAMTPSQSEFVSRNRVFVVGETFTGESGTKYQAIAVGKPLPQGQRVLIEALPRGGRDA